MADVALLLGRAMSADDAGPSGRSGSDEEILAALDFDPTGHDDAGAAEPIEIPEDPALARLLPPASEDPELAAELRGLTETTLRSQKADRLAALWRALREAGNGTAEPVVRIAPDAEGEWLAALTDVRLVLAARLGIENEADLEGLRERALNSVEGDAASGDGTESEVTAAMVTMYQALTWWQESLLQSIVRRGGRG